MDRRQKYIHDRRVSLDAPNGASDCDDYTHPGSGDWSRNDCSGSDVMSDCEQANEDADTIIKLTRRYFELQAKYDALKKDATAVIDSADRPNYEEMSVGVCAAAFDALEARLEEQSDERETRGKWDWDDEDIDLGFDNQGGDFP